MNLLRKSEIGLFASQSLAGHLLRGTVAFGLLAFALTYQHERPLWAAAAALAALVAMRGCPICWAIGLAETVQQRWRRRPSG